MQERYARLHAVPKGDHLTAGEVLSRALASRELTRARWFEALSSTFRAELWAATSGDADAMRELMARNKSHARLDKALLQRLGSDSYPRPKEGALALVQHRRDRLLRGRGAAAGEGAQTGEGIAAEAERLEALYGKLEALPPGAMQSKVSRRSNAKPSAEQLCAIDTRPPCGLRR